MSDDPYAALGVAKTATHDEIRKAYKKIAKESHPDLNPGDAKAAARFKAAVGGARPAEGPREAARASTRGEIDAIGPGAAGAQVLPRVRRGAGGDLPHQPRLRGLRRHVRRLRRPLRRPGARRGAAGGQGIRMRGPDRHYTLEVGFLEAAQGRDAADHPAGRPGARREDPGRASPTARRSGCAARAARGSAAAPAGDALVTVDGRAARLLPPRGRRHPGRAADHARRGGARRQGRGADRSTGGWR